MSPEVIQGTLPRTRPRAATDRAQPAKGAFLSPHQASQTMGPQSVSMARSPERNQAEARDYMRARATTGPLRQPKPLSPSEIHLILEQEQEAMVNRLSRELSHLRHRSSSVASTASSSSTTVNEPLDAFHGSQYLTGHLYPTSSRRHRSSSSLSGSYFPIVQGPRTSSRSRRQSFASSQRSQSVMPVASQTQERSRDVSTHVTPSSRLYLRRNSQSQQRTSSGPNVRSDGTPLMDMESLMNENETLRRRIRALELELSFQRNQSSPKLHS